MVSIMKLSIFYIDAFTDQRFKGNPAAVVPLNTWLPEADMQAIATENNLSETAFFVREDGKFLIRWFSPMTEITFCGHATLARSEEHTSELQSLMRISYAVFCLKKKTKN